MSQILVTLDTNLLDGKGAAQLIRDASGLPLKFYAVSVSDREQEHTKFRVQFEQVLQAAPILETGVYGESRYGEAVYGGSVAEVFVLDESQLDVGVVGSDSGADRFEQILAIITDNSFPKRGKRDDLTPGQRKQLRDAMILDAHCEHGHDILVTQDEKAFLRGDHKQRLEALCRTQIMTPGMFATYCNSLRAQRQ